MSILVTGTASHLGEALVRSLRARSERRGAYRRAALAALHKPHVATPRCQEFIDTNVTGTLVLLEAAITTGVRSFVYISTTSAFGSSLSRPSSAPAIWVTEVLPSGQRNIYGVSKVMAENLCELMHQRSRLPVRVLRTSRFVPEDDDSADIRRQHQTTNAQLHEFLYRRVDIEDAVSAVMRALERAADRGFSRSIISAATPFTSDDLPHLGQDAPSVLRRLFLEIESFYAARHCRPLPQIDRAYVNNRARTELGWTPKCDFAFALKCLRGGQDFRSALSRKVGREGY